MMAATALPSVRASCAVQLTGIVGSGVPARVHPASPGSALEDLDQFRCAIRRVPQFLWRERARACLDTRARHAHVGLPSHASRLEQSEGTDRRSPATRDSDWGDRSRCSRAWVWGNGTCRVVPSHESNAQPLLGSCGPPQVGRRLRSPTQARIKSMRWCAVGGSTATLFRSWWTDAGRCGQPTVSNRHRHAVWGPCGVSRARLLRVPFVCPQPAGGAAAPASVPHAHGVFSPRTPSPLLLTTPSLPRMTRGKGANDSRRLCTQRNLNCTRCPPLPPSPCENACEHADMPPPPPPLPPPPVPRAAPGGHRPPPGFCRAAEGGQPRPLKRPYSPLGRGRRHGDRDDCDQQRLQVRHRGDWDGPGFDGGPLGPVRAHPRGGGNNDAEPPAGALWRPFLSYKRPAIRPQPLWSKRLAPAGWSPPRPAARSAASTFSRSRVPLVRHSTPAAASAAGPSPQPAQTSALFQGRHRRQPLPHFAATAAGPTSWPANGRLGLAKGRRLGPAVGPAAPPLGPSSRLAVGALLRGVGRRPTPRLGVCTTGDSVALA